MWEEYGPASLSYMQKLSLTISAQHRSLIGLDEFEYGMAIAWQQMLHRWSHERDLGASRGMRPKLYRIAFNIATIPTCKPLKTNLPGSFVM